jgi:hypothetical protein
LAAEMQRRQAAEEARKRYEAEERARAERRRAAQKRWPAVLSDIRTAVGEINHHLAALKLAFRVKEGQKSSAAIAQLNIVLEATNAASDDRQVALNVNAYGHVEPVFLIPYTGRNPSAFEISEVNADFWSAMLVDFLEQALARDDK